MPLACGFTYLAALLDWYSRYVIAWRLSNTLGGSFCLELLEEALSKGRPAVSNTAQGAPFTAQAWAGRLEAARTAGSMGGQGRCLDDVFVERRWRAVKYEDIHLWRCEDVPHLRRGLGRYSPDDNEGRPHRALDYRTPAAVYREGREASNNGILSPPRPPSAPVKGGRGGERMPGSRRQGERVATMSESGVPWDGS